MKRYTDEQTAMLQGIADSPKEEWNDKITSVMVHMGDREPSTVWQKVYSLSDTYPGRKGNGHIKKPKKKVAKKAAKKVAKKKAKEKTRTQEDRDKKAAYNREWRANRKKNDVKTSEGTRPYKRKLHSSPLRGTTMRATANEVRFPVESIRIETGELIVTFK